MKKKKLNIAYLNINRFNPVLCDGVSVSSLELLEFLATQGHETVILTYSTNEPFKQNIFYQAVRQHAPELQGKKLQSFSYMMGHIAVHAELLPFDQTELFANHGYILKLMNQKIAEKKINYLLTVDDDFLSMLPGLTLGLPGAHFFHSPAYLSPYQQVPFLIKSLKKRKLFAVSGFMQAKIKKELGLDADPWYPLFDLEKYRLKQSGRQNDPVGYYSAGRHKGDDIFNRLVVDLPDRDFIVIGQYYTHGFARIPGNLHVWGDNRDSKRFYDSIGLLLAPSLIEEGFPRVILEAAANGIPTVANSLGGIPEALADSGIRVEVDAAELAAAGIGKLASIYRQDIEHIGTDESFYRELQQKALKRAQVYMDQQAALSMKNLAKMLGA
ncbi:MAG: glycosyltransferase family 4 protein [Candidatus Aminicenantes bacterium]|nr:glycosyltransferase family 4 protein [Candidatus Aminicenantes bacterium]